MFIENRYHIRYFNIINNAMSRKNEGYTEKHHITPKCMGGTNEPDNLIRLTAREHFICHRLLAKCVTDDYRSKLVYASWQLGRSLKLKGVKISSRLYEQLKIELSESMTGRKRPEFSQEWKDNMSKSRKGKPSPKRGIVLTDEHKQKLSEARKGKPHPINITDERREELSNHFSGMWKGKPKKKSPCPHCDLAVAPNIMSRWHGDNCKSLLG